MEMPTDKRVRILLVEDEPLWQQGIQALLETSACFGLVGVADCFDDALLLYRDLKPDVVLLDWKIFGSKDGLALGAAILEEGHPVERLVLITGSPASSIPAHPFLYIPKTHILDDLLPLLESVTGRL
jgi:DNA-binding NarL/FixJ family response regulator